MSVYLSVCGSIPAADCISVDNVREVGQKDRQVQSLVLRCLALVEMIRTGAWVKYLRSSLFPFLTCVWSLFQNVSSLVSIRCQRIWLRNKV